MSSIFSIFKSGFQKTATAIGRTISSAFTDVKKWEDSNFTNLENALIEADFGAATAKKITADLRDRYERGLLSGKDDFLNTAKDSIVNAVSANIRPLAFPEDGPGVLLMVGVNGGGKTTSAGKLAWIWTRAGKKVSLAACDTFRAAASEQLKLWADKTGADLIFSKHGANPSAVAFDAVKAAISRGADRLIIDTAGRQHNKKALMDELVKIRRTIEKLLPGAPHETLLVIDASIGINAMNQAREFASAAGVTGIILTKLDGTGKGGSIVRINEELALPVFFAGFGEQPDDLQEFDPENYAKAVLGME